mmetsp:Transcript_52335/g.147357  ORF Transcript_52335/g.147357 Transcript_52335/m.147357 type:complete len:540 (-) Transcript_52335:93-1712(-)
MAQGAEAAFEEAVASLRLAHRQSVETLQEENLALKREIDILREQRQLLQAKIDEPSAPIQLQPACPDIPIVTADWRSLLRSEVVCINVANESSSALIHVHASVLQDVPYFEVRGARWERDGPIDLQLPCNCPMLAAYLVVQRLYGGVWSIPTWQIACQDDLECALGAALIAKMLMLPLLTDEIVPVVRSLATDAGSRSMLSDAATKFEIPELNDYSDCRLTANFDPQLAEQMVSNAVCEEAGRDAASSVLAAWQQEGASSKQLVEVMLEVMRGKKYMTKTRSKAYSGIFRYPCALADEGVSIKSGAFSWLWSLLRKHLMRNPDYFERVCDAFAVLRDTEYWFRANSRGRASALGQSSRFMQLAEHAKLEVRSAFGEFLLLVTQWLQQGSIELEGYLRAVGFLSGAHPKMILGQASLIQEYHNLFKVPWAYADCNTSSEDLSHFVEVYTQMFSAVSSDARNRLFSAAISNKQWCLLTLQMVRIVPEEQQLEFVEGVQWNELSVSHCQCLRGSALRAAKAKLLTHVGQLHAELRDLLHPDA